MAKSFRQALARLAPAAVLLAAGCGPSVKFNEQVEGTVTLDGAPLPQVMVQFVPDVTGPSDAPTASGYTDENGHFKLTHDGDRPGAAVGKYRVVVLQGRGGRASDDPDAPVLPPPPGPRLPPQYAVAAQTPLRQGVTAAQHTYDLPLTLGAAPGGGRDD
jgi:hypothetical protein